MPTLMPMLRFGFNKVSGLFCKKGIKPVALVFTTPATAHAFSINLSTFDRTITHITGCNNKHLLCF
jgi:hypothetical protein